MANVEINVEPCEVRAGAGDVYSKAAQVFAVDELNGGNLAVMKLLRAIHEGRVDVESFDWDSM